jgi:hypothetical protein
MWMEGNGRRTAAKEQPSAEEDGTRIARRKMGRGFLKGGLVTVLQELYSCGCNTGGGYGRAKCARSAGGRRTAVHEWGREYSNGWRASLERAFSLSFRTLSILYIRCPITPVFSGEGRVNLFLLKKVIRELIHGCICEVDGYFYIRYSPQSRRERRVFM